MVNWLKPSYTYDVGFMNKWFVPFNVNIILTNPIYARHERILSGVKL